MLQLLVVLVTGSVALLADTTHNFADALTGIPLWVAFAIGRRAATRRFTYGYRRAEDVAGLFVVLLIALSAALAAWESVDRLVSPQPVSHLALVAVAGLVGFLGNELIALYRIRVGREIGSTALVVDGLHARTDGLTSLAVVIGTMGLALGLPQADPIVGLAITVAILVVLKDAALQMLARLMDAVDPAITLAAERVAHQGRGGGHERPNPLARPSSRGRGVYHRRAEADIRPRWGQPHFTVTLSGEAGHGLSGIVRCR